MIEEYQTYDISTKKILYLQSCGIFCSDTEVLLDPILHRFPAMHDAQVRQLINGPESFTPDQNWNIGESPEVLYFNFHKSQNGIRIFELLQNLNFKMRYILN